MRRALLPVALLSIFLLAPSVLADPTPPAAEPATKVVTADAPVAKPAASEAAVADDKVVKDADKVVIDPDKVVDDAVKSIDDNPGETLKELIQLAKEGRWGPFAGLLLMLIIWVTRKWVWKLIPKNVLPWLTLGLGMTVTVASELLLGVVWWKTLIDGLATSGIAMAFWSAVFKHFLSGDNPDGGATDG